MNDRPAPSFKFVDLFAGIGGFRSALTALGGEHVYTNEWNKPARQTYSSWYGSENIDSTDIREVDPASIPDHHFLTAGFPCQPFSIAGVSKKNSLNRPHGFDDPHQGNLFFALAKIIEIKRPPVFMLENVKNLVSHDKGNTWKVISQILSDLDYVFDMSVISSESVVPQKRQRVFISGFDSRVFGKEVIKQHFNFPSFQGSPMALSSILEKDPDPKYMLTENLWRYLQAYREKHQKAGNGFGFKLFGPSDTARTLSARYYKDGADILISQPNWPRPRRLTPNEAMRLMGFDSRYAKYFGHEHGFEQVVSDVQMYKQCGNAVVPQVVEAVAAEMLATVNRLGGFEPL